MKGMPAAGECSKIVGSFAGGADAHAHVVGQREEGAKETSRGREGAREGASEREVQPVQSLTCTQLSMSKRPKNSVSKKSNEKNEKIKNAKCKS